MAHLTTDAEHDRPYRALAAAVLLCGMREARAGRVEALRWFWSDASGPMTAAWWASHLDIDMDQLRRGYRERSHAARLTGARLNHRTR